MTQTTERLETKLRYASDLKGFSSVTKKAVVARLRTINKDYEADHGLFVFPSYAYHDQ